MLAYVRPDTNPGATCISCDLLTISHALDRSTRDHCGSTRDRNKITRHISGTEISVRSHRRRNMLYGGSDAPSNVANRPGGRPERSDTCDPSTAILIHLRVALSGTCHDQLRPDSLETGGYRKRCSIDCVSACSTLIPALSSLKPSTYTRQLRVGDAASRAEAVMSDGTR